MRAKRPILVGIRAVAKHAGMIARRRHPAGKASTGVVQVYGIAAATRAMRRNDSIAAGGVDGYGCHRACILYNVIGCGSFDPLGCGVHLNKHCAVR